MSRFLGDTSDILVAARGSFPDAFRKSSVLLVNIVEGSGLATIFLSSAERSAEDPGFSDQGCLRMSTSCREEVHSSETLLSQAGLRNELFRVSLS